MTAGRNCLNWDEMVWVRESRDGRIALKDVAHPGDVLLDQRMAPKV